MSRSYTVTLYIEVKDEERLRLAAAKYADESGVEPERWEAMRTGPEDDLRMLLDHTTVEDAGFEIADSSAEAH